MSEHITPAEKKSWLNRALNAIEVVGNKLPDPAVLFALLMIAVWVVSWLLSGVTFNEVDPRTGAAIQVNNLLAADSLTTFMAKMVNTFVTFAPLGVVLVAMLGLGVAEHTGFINAGLRSVLSVTPKMLLTPVLIAVGVASHMAVDAGYVLVIPLGAVIFYAAGRHPLAGIAAAFAGVSGGFSATILPSSLDPLLSGLTQVSARLSSDPAAANMFISPMNNYYFTTASTILVVLIGWVLTDKFIEPRLKATQVDGDPADMPKMDELTPNERKGLRWASFSMLLSIVLLIVSALPETSAWRAPAGTVLAEGQSSLLVFAAP
ncbi:MAG TPA: AbgT family transporter, partial [Rheinheimera sp.]|nr:AbgT family transporter [Rheinheimera sp.]